ncbi:hypothetical protein E4U54_004237 [Claviceps lovelessii]|nr:hypothetical protein E4U54_004237 [Claviceps lovelessii]
MSAVDTYFDESFWVNPALNDVVSFGSGDGHHNHVFGLPPEQCHHFYVPSLSSGEIAHHHHHHPPAPLPLHSGHEQYSNNDVGHNWPQFSAAAAQTYGKYVLHQSPHIVGSDRAMARITPTPSPPPIQDHSWAQSQSQSPLSDTSPLHSDEVPDESPQHHHHHPNPNPNPETKPPSKRGRRANGTGAGTGTGTGTGKKPSFAFSSSSSTAKGAFAETKPPRQAAKCNNALERNRLAATNFRKRTKESVHKLETVKANLESKHQELQSEYSKLSYEVLQLKNDLMFHAACHDDKIDIWIKREAQNYTQKLVSDRQMQSPNYVSGGPFDGQFNDFSSVSPVTTEGFTSLFSCSPGLDDRDATM